MAVQVRLTRGHSAVALLVHVYDYIVWLCSYLRLSTVLPESAARNSTETPDMQ